MGELSQTTQANAGSPN